MSRGWSQILTATERDVARKLGDEVVLLRLGTAGACIKLADGAKLGAKHKRVSLRAMCGAA